jgi:5-methyltetrahydropteroyltriglutamate--homocysteine methyltransferase
MKLPEQDRILTAIVGSYPKPSYIYPSSGRKLLDSVGFSFDSYRSESRDTDFDQLLDKAALQAIGDQDQAGIDLVTDGEERRGHYVLSIVNKLRGIDFQHLKNISIRGGVSHRDVPRVINKISYDGPILLDEFSFTSQHTTHTPKIGLPGPITVADCLADEYYHGDRQQLAYDYADAIRREVSNLIAAGCRVIQFDDPVLLRYPEAAQAWGFKALERCFAGFEDKATFIVHICRGYPDKALEKKGIEYKANKYDYPDVLSMLSTSKLDILSIEGAQSNLDLSILQAAGDKTVMLGLLDVGTNDVESVEYLVEQGQEALKYLPKNQLILAPDCGMLELSRGASKQKLGNLVVAAQMLNSKL